MIVDVYSLTGKKSSKITLPKEIFGIKANQLLLAQSIRVYLSNQRQKGTAKTKRRGEVVGSTRKIYKQKGTGRARHGDRKAPVFVGGGIAHGPTGRENYRRQMSRRMRRLALFGALSDKLKTGHITVVKGLESIKPKTKELVKVLSSFKLLDKQGELIAPTLVILPDKVDNIILAGRNIPRLELTSAKQLNSYQILKNDRLLITTDSIPVLSSVYLISGSSPKKPTVRKKAPKAKPN